MDYAQALLLRASPVACSMERVKYVEIQWHNRTVANQSRRCGFKSEQIPQFGQHLLAGHGLFSLCQHVANVL
jgi:hypothetical protein